MVWNDQTSSANTVIAMSAVAIAIATMSPTSYPVVGAAEPSSIFDSPGASISNQPDANFWNGDMFAVSIIRDEKRYRAMDKIAQISTLMDNWNGYGAKAFSKGLLDKTRRIVAGLNQVPQIFPTACNSIQLEYDGEKESYLEFEITEFDVEASAFMIDKEGNEKEFTVNANVEGISGVLDEFYG